MKVAVIFFGLCRGYVKECLDTHHTHFSQYDTFYGTWSDITSLSDKHLANQKDLEAVIPNIPYVTAPEPKMHYHPAIDIDLSDLHKNAREHLTPIFKQKARRSKAQQNTPKDRILHHTKQILGHAFMLSQLPEEYDMIIRARYDVQLSSEVDFAPFIEQSYEEKRAIGFGDTLGGYQRDFNFDRLKINKNPPPYYLTDFLIFHPRKLFDVDKIQKLHSNHQLLPGEHGWYQTLSHPHDNHLNILGGAYLDRLYRKGKLK